MVFALFAVFGVLFAFIVGGYLAGRNPH